MRRRITKTSISTKPIRRPCRRVGVTPTRVLVLYHFPTQTITQLHSSATPPGLRSKIDISRGDPTHFLRGGGGWSKKLHPKNDQTLHRIQNELDAKIIENLTPTWALNFAKIHVQQILKNHGFL